MARKGNQLAKITAVYQRQSALIRFIQQGDISEQLNISVLGS